MRDRVTMGWRIANPLFDHNGKAYCNCRRQNGAVPHRRLRVSAWMCFNLPQTQYSTILLHKHLDLWCVQRRCTLRTSGCKTVTPNEGEYEEA